MGESYLEGTPLQLFAGKNVTHLGDGWSIVGNEPAKYDVPGELMKLGQPLIKHSNYLYCRWFLPTKTTWNIEKVEKKICYGIVSKYAARNKIPPNMDEIMEKLRGMYPGFEFVELSRPLTVADYVRELSSCYFFFGTDNGIGHINRSVGAPMFILRYKHGIDHCFVPEFCNYHEIKFQDEDIEDQIKSYLSAKYYTGKYSDYMNFQGFHT
jgi:hypothetical protein